MFLLWLLPIIKIHTHRTHSCLMLDTMFSCYICFYTTHDHKDQRQSVAIQEVMSLQLVPAWATFGRQKFQGVIRGHGPGSSPSSNMTLACIHLLTQSSVGNVTFRQRRRITDSEPWDMQPVESGDAPKTKVLISLILDTQTLITEPHGKLVPL